MISIINLIAGGLIGVVGNHFYSVNLRQPKLGYSGSGANSNFYDTGFSSATISVQNELRHLSVKFPPIIILGKRIKTQIGNQTTERDVAKKCAAHLYDENGKLITRLYWLSNNKPLYEVDINSGESASLMTFVRKKMNLENFIYTNQFLPII